MEVVGSLVELTEPFPVKKKTKPLKDHVPVESGISKGWTTLKILNVRHFPPLITHSHTRTKQIGDHWDLEMQGYFW